MTPYFDPRWLVLLVVHTAGIQRAWALVNRFAAPYVLNPMHQLTLENALHRQLLDSNPTLKQAALIGLRRWQNQLAEQVFAVRPPDWLMAYQLALQWNRENSGRPTIHGNLLHVALAKTGSATHFFSLDAEARALATTKGLSVLPESS